jgi:hypothetical protein
VGPLREDVGVRGCLGQLGSETGKKKAEKGGVIKQGVLAQRELSTPRDGVDNPHCPLVLAEPRGSQLSDNRPPLGDPVSNVVAPPRHLVGERGGVARSSHGPALRLMPTAANFGQASFNTTFYLVVTSGWENNSLL